MNDMSLLIHDPAYERDIVIQRTSKGHFEKSVYVPATTIITFKGIMVDPKTGKMIVQTHQGDRAVGYVNIYVDSDSEIFATRERTDGKNISDIFIDRYGTPYATNYRINNIYDYSDEGFFKAECFREGAL